MKSYSTLKDMANSLEREILSILKVEVSKQGIASRKLQAEVKSKLSRIEESERALVEVDNSGPSRMVLSIPILGERRSLQHRARVDKLTTRIGELKTGLKEARRKLSARSNKVNSLKKTVVSVRSMMRILAVPNLESDIEIETVLSRFHLRVDHIKKSKSFRKGDDLQKVISQEAPFLKSWIKDQRELLALRRKPAARPPRLEVDNSRPNKQPPKIYIPAPESMSDDLQRMGFRVDPSVTRGSAIYFDPLRDMDVARRMQPSLPLAARRHKTKFSFQEIAWDAKSQNLHQVFDKDGWRLIRGRLTANTGMRCVVCGSRGGNLLKTLPEEQHKSESVECHEVWSWEVLDEHHGLGVQKLQDILVLCVDCHATFHEGQMISRVRKAGGDPDMVKTFLRDRMSQMTGLALSEIEEQRNVEIATREKLKDIDKWILDLSYLDEHQYLTGSMPVLQSDNPAGVRAEMIAGTDFMDEHGDVYDSQSVEDVYKAMLAEIDYVQKVSTAGLTSSPP